MWPDGEVKLLSDQALDSVHVAEACEGHANLKPRFTDAPWKMALFTHAITQTRKIGVMLTAMEWSVSEGNSIEWSSAFWNGSFSREMYGGIESCSAGVDEMREMASTTKTEVLTELKGCTE